ncbi:MAG: hypothetical protein WCG42_00690 [Parachlamydiaceae bacterium]
MSRKNRTKDENFVISLYEEAEKSGNAEAPVDRYHAGERAHLAPKGVDTICKLLIQANFVKKSGEVDVYLTPHGLKLAERLRCE